MNIQEGKLHLFFFIIIIFLKKRLNLKFRMLDCVSRRVSVPTS